MKSTASVLVRVGFAVLFVLGMFVSVSPVSAAGNRCKDRCNERYHRRVEECRDRRGRERRRCEKNAQDERDECRHRCR